MCIRDRSLHRGGTLFELASPRSVGVELVTVDEVVRRGVTLRPVLAGSLEQLHELVDVLAVQRVSVDIPVERCRPEQLKSVLKQLYQRTTTGRIVVEYS